METPGDSTFRSRFWRMVRAACVIYFASLTTIPVIGCVYRDDPRVVVICFLILLLTGVALDSGPIVLMILGAGLAYTFSLPVGNGLEIARNERDALIGHFSVLCLAPCLISGDAPLSPL